MCRISHKKSLVSVQHSYSKTFHGFLKRSVFRETKFLGKNPLILVKINISILMFYPIETPRKNMMAAGGAHFLKENPLVCAGCSVNFTPACAWWKS